jgi:hypothetical protein
MIMRTVRKAKMRGISAGVLHHSLAVVLMANSLHCTSVHGSNSPENVKENQVRKYKIVINSRRLLWVEHRGNKKCLQNHGTEMPWKATTWQTKMEMRL